jgi:hypothetical protein
MKLVICTLVVACCMLSSVGTAQSACLRCHSRGGCGLVAGRDWLHYPLRAAAARRASRVSGRACSGNSCS